MQYKLAFIDANDIFNEITGGIHECDLIYSENLSDDIFIPKDSAALNLSNDSESMSYVGQNYISNLKSSTLEISNHYILRSVWFSMNESQRFI
ncbi:unnamed protein product [Gordionus sp. m RMFG-2023]